MQNKIDREFFGTFWLVFGGWAGPAPSWRPPFRKIGIGLLGCQLWFDRDNGLDRADNGLCRRTISAYISIRRFPSNSPSPAASRNEFVPYVDGTGRRRGCGGRGSSCRRFR